MGLRELMNDKAPESSAVKISKRRILWERDLWDEVCYLSGVMVGDGYIVKRDECVGLDVTHRDFADSFKECLETIGLRPSLSERVQDDENHSDIYRVRCYSNQLKEFIENYIYRFNELENIVTHREDSNKYFVKGLYESEGNIHETDSGYIMSLNNQRESIIDLARLSMAWQGVMANKSCDRRSDREGDGRKDIYKLTICGEEKIDRATSVIDPVIKHPRSLANWDMTY